MNVLDTLGEKQKEILLVGLRDKLANLPSGAYNAQLRNLTGKFGADFMSQLLAPTTRPTEETEEAPPVDLSQALPTKEPGTPWYAKPVKWAAENIPGVEPVLKGISWLEQRTAEPAALGAVYGVEKLMPGQQAIEKKMTEYGTVNPWALTPAQKEEAWESQNLPWGVRGGL